MVGIRRTCRTTAAAVAAVLALTGTAWAADEYPNKPVKLILPAAAGGPTDVPARIASASTAAQARSAGGDREPPWRRRRARRPRRRGRRAGWLYPAGGEHERACRDPRGVGSAGYDPVKNFVPIVRMTESFQILVVNATRHGRRSSSSSITARPTPASSTTPTPVQAACRIWSAELFMLRSGCNMTAVPYRSGGESVTAVLSKAVDTTIEGIAITRSLNP